ETSGNRSSSAVANASSRVSSAAPTTVASRSCLPRKCRYSADGPIATASATSPMATLAYPLRQNRSVAASMISCRRFDGRVPRAGRTTFCTGPAVISPLESHGFEVLDGFAKSGNLIGGVAPIFHPQFAFQDLAGSRHRHGVDEVHAARGLVAGDECLAVSAQLLLGRVLTWQ